MEYEILEAISRLKLVKAVNIALLNGWIPIGGVEIDQYGMFYQAIG